MQPGGVWVAIKLEDLPANDCAKANLQFGGVLRQEDVRSAGATVTRYVLDNQPWVVLNLEHGGTCYELYFIMFEPETRDQNLPVIDAMLSTFEFTPK